MNILIGKDIKSDVKTQITLDKLVHYIRTNINPFTSTKFTTRKENSPVLIGGVSEFKVQEDSTKLNRNKDLIKTFSGFMVFDIDIEKRTNTYSLDKYNLTDDEKIKSFNDIEKIKKSFNLVQYFFLIKKSFSGTGLHLFLNIKDAEITTVDDYEKLYEALLYHFSLDIESVEKKHNLNYKYKFDEACKDAARAFFFNADTDLIYEKDYGTLLKDDYIDILKQYNERIQGHTLYNNNLIKVDGTELYEKGLNKAYDLMYNILYNNVSGETLKRYKVVKIDGKNVRTKKLEDYYKIYDDGKYGNDRHKKLVDFLNNRKNGKNIYSWGSSIYWVLKNLKKEQRIIFYRFIKGTYIRQGGDNKKLIQSLNTFEDFNNYLENTYTLKGNKQFGLYNFFKGSGVIGLDKTIYSRKEGFDYFDNKYTIEYNLKEKYIGLDLELKKDLNKTILDNNIVLIKADAGLGKTTYIFDHIIENLDKYNNVLFLALKTSMLDQLYNLFNERIEGLDLDINIVKNYSKNKYTLQYKNIIFSTIQGIDKIEHLDFSLTIVDEAHLLTSFASLINKDENAPIGFIYEKLKNKNKMVFISATMERFATSLTFEKYIYFNIIKNIEKPILKEVRGNNTHNLCLNMMKNNLDDNNINMIFNNNINENKKLKERIFDELGKEAIIISSLNKYDPEVLDIIENQELKEGAIYLTTSYIGEGLNINNTGTTYIYTIDTYNTDFDTIYQFIKRFRKTTPYNYFLTSTINFEKDYMNNGGKYNFESKLKDIKYQGEALKDNFIDKSISWINNKGFDIVKYMDDYYIDYNGEIDTLLDTEYNLELKNNIFYREAHINNNFEYVKDFTYIIDDKKENYKATTQDILDFKPIWFSKKIYERYNDIDFYNEIYSGGTFFDYINIIKIIKNNYEELNATKKQFNIVNNDTFEDLFDEFGNKIDNIDDIIFNIRIKFLFELKKYEMIQINKMKHKDIDEGGVKIIKKDIELLKKFIDKNKVKTKKYEYIEIEKINEYIKSDKRINNQYNRYNLINCLGYKKKRIYKNKERYNVLIINNL